MNAVVTRERNTRIGASEAAKILNLTPGSYGNAYSTWLEKTGQLEEWQGNEATEDGQLYEPVLLDKAEKKLGLLKRDLFLPSPAGAPIGATLDALVIDTGDVVEAKTTGLGERPIVGQWGDEGTSDIPDYYIVQTQLQMHCSGAGQAHVVAWVGHRGVRWYLVQRDEELISNLVVMLSDWWDKHIIGQTPPSILNPPPVDVLKRIRRQPAKTIVLGKSGDTRFIAWEKAKSRLAKAKAKEEEAKAKLLLLLGDAEQGTTPSGATITYLESERKGYTVQPSRFRTLKVSQPKGDK